MTNPSGINLLPTEYQESGRHAGQLARAGLFCFGELLILGGAVLAMYTYHRQTAERWNSLELQVAEQRALINREDNRRLEGKLLTVKGKIASLQTHFNEQGLYADFIDGITAKLPAGIRLLSLKQSGTWQEFELAGQTEKIEQVDSLVKTLSDWEKIQTVDIKSCDLRLDKNEVVFTLSITRL